MNPVRNNLVALGSAAVLAIYSAGYLRTRSAAERFADEDSGRRQAAPTVEQPVHDSAPPLVTTVPVNDLEPAAVVTTRTPPPLAQVTPAPTKVTVHADTVPTGKAVTTPAPAATVLAAPRQDSTIMPQIVAATPPVPAPAPTPGLQGTAGVQLADSAPTTPARAVLKDGSYSGWGTSRHGDIQATVEIRDGKIVSAAISQCRTRYSCSWISHLPGQVVTRQSADVDYVSGATQSSNAFYYAIVEALTKAK